MSLRLTLIGVVPLLCIVAACADDATLGPTSQPLASISDAMHDEGNPHFFFLPPMVSQPTFEGVFDGSLTPVVHISENGETLVDLIATVSLDDEHYHANWHTRELDLDATKTYRITVLAEQTTLGFADVDVVSSGNELKHVATGEYIPLKDGRTLPIMFRIEEGAIPPAPSVSLVWFNMMNGAQASSTSSVLETLGDVKISVMPSLGVPVADADLYSVYTSPGGTPLDEAQTLQALGLTADGTVLYTGRM